MRKDLAFFKTWLALFPLISKDHVAFIVKRVKQFTKNFLLDCWTLGDQGNANAGNHSVSDSVSQPREL